MHMIIDVTCSAVDPQLKYKTYSDPLDDKSELSCRGLLRGGLSSVVLLASVCTICPQPL